MNHFQSGKGLFNHPQNFGILKFPSVVTLEKAGRGAQEGKADGEVCCHCLCCLSGQRLQKAELREMGNIAAQAMQGVNGNSYRVGGAADLLYAAAGMKKELY